MSLKEKDIDLVMQLIEKELGKDHDKLKAIRNQMKSLHHSDPYINISQYSHDLMARMTAQGHGLVTQNPGDELLGVFMERDNIARLLAWVPTDGYLFASVGIHTSPRTEMTISLLAADSAKQIIGPHTAGTINGEEVWQERANFSQLNQIFP